MQHPFTGLAIPAQTWTTGPRLHIRITAADAIATAPQTYQGLSTKSVLYTVAHQLNHIAWAASIAPVHPELDPDAVTLTYTVPDRT